MLPALQPTQIPRYTSSTARCHVYKTERKERYQSVAQSDETHLEPASSPRWTPPRRTLQPGCTQCCGWAGTSRGRGCGGWWRPSPGTPSSGRTTGSTCTCRREIHRQLKTNRGHNIALAFWLWLKNKSRKKYNTWFVLQHVSHESRSLIIRLAMIVCVFLPLLAVTVVHGQSVQLITELQRSLTTHSVFASMHRLLKALGDGLVKALV